MHLKRLGTLVLLCLIPFISNCDNAAVSYTGEDAVVGIIGATGLEVDSLKALLDDKIVFNIGSHEYLKGTLQGKKVVLVACGSGKVNAAMSAAILIERFRAKSLIMTGVAGAINPDLEIGDFVVSRDMIQHDVDCTAMNNPPGQMCDMDHYIYSADTYLSDMAMEVIVELYVDVGALNGRILTGDQYISDIQERILLFDMFAGDCVEMEGAAVGQVVYNYHQEVPFVDIRVISDKADGEAPDDQKKFEKMAARRAENIILHMLERI